MILIAPVDHYHYLGSLGGTLGLIALVDRFSRGGGGLFLIATADHYHYLGFQGGTLFLIAPADHYHILVSRLN